MRRMTHERPIFESEQALRTETEGKTTLIGFVGAPWTLAAYSIEGGSSKYALHTKKMMMEEPALFHSLMTKLANSIGDYACYQVHAVLGLLENNPEYVEVFVKLFLVIFCAQYILFIASVGSTAVEE